MFHHAIATVFGVTTQDNNKWDGRLHLSWTPHFAIGGQPNFSLPKVEEVTLIFHS
jgi:hypothetical protein